MADVIGRGVIELVADARKLRAGVDDAKKSIRTLGEGQRDISRSAQRSIDQYIGKLNLQNATVGKSAREAELMRLAFRGASNEQLKAADTALRFREAQEKIAETQARNARALSALKYGFVAFGAAAVAGIGAAAVALDSLAKKTSEFQDAAEQMGDVAENVASLAVAAAGGGTDIKTLADASSKLTKVLTGVGDETDDAGAALKALGLDIAQFKSLGAVDQFSALAKALNQFEDGTAKAAVAQALFGKTGAQLLPFLKELEVGAGRQNILTQEQIQLADAYADRQAVLGAQISLYAQAIASQFVPAATSLQEAFIDVLKGIIGVQDGVQGLSNDKAIQEFADNVARAIAFVIDSVDGLVRVFNAARITITEFYDTAKGLATFNGQAIKDAEKAADSARLANITRPQLGQALEARIAARKQAEAEAASFVGPQVPPGGIRPKLKFEGRVDKPKKESGPDPLEEARALARDQLASDLQDIKTASEAQINAFSNAEKILQAQRSASLVDEQQYYEAKRGFIQLNAQEQERALQAEIARLQQERFAGKNAAKDYSENQRKIQDAETKLAKIRADAVANTEVNAIQQAAALKKVEQAYEDAQIAAGQYLDTIRRQNARDIAGVGRGTRFREEQSGINEIEDRALKERQRLEGELRRGDIDRTKFDQYIGIANQTYQEEVRLYRERTAKLRELEGDWVNGATEALANYIDEVHNIAKQTEDALTGAFRGLEDVLTDLSSGGIKSFKDLKTAATDLATSIVTDVNRIIIKQNITGPLAEALQGQLGQGGFLAGLLPQFGVTPFNPDPRANSPLPGAIGGIAGQVAGGGAQAANAAAFSTQVAAAGTTFSTTTATAGTTFASSISAAGAAFTPEVAAAGATFTTEVAASGATMTAEIATAGATFAAEVAAAGSAFAATVAAAGAGESAGSAATGLIGGLLGSFDTGTAYVPRTGPYMLHEGERVVTAAENRSGDSGAAPISVSITIQGNASRETTNHMVAELRRELGRNQTRRIA